jgi:hypothetical protein
VDDSADRSASFSEWLLNHASTCPASVISTLAVVTRAPRCFDLSDRVDGCVMPVVARPVRPAVSRRDLAAAQQRNMTCPAFGKVCRDRAAQGSGSTGDDVGRIRGEFGGERLASGSARAKTRNECRARRGWRSDPRARRQDVLADARAVSARSSASSMSISPPHRLTNSWWPMTRPSPQMAACSTASASVPGAGCALAVIK